MLKWVVIFLISFSAFGQELPEHLTSMLNKTREYCVEYAQKLPSNLSVEAFEASEGEELLLMHIDQVNGLEFTFSKDEIRDYKTQLVIVLAEIFSSDQLMELEKIIRKKLNKKKAARYLGVALEYQQGKIRSDKISRRLSSIF